MSQGFYATLDADTVKPYIPAEMNVMLPIASWWRHDVELRRPPTVPQHVGSVAIDTGSYTLAQAFADGYPYGWTPDSLVSWIAGVKGAYVKWAVLPDWPCEGKSPDEVREIQARGDATTAALLIRFRHVPWVWCPVLQGQTVEDYLRHAVAQADIIDGLAHFYRMRGQLADFRVCIGSICRQGQVTEIRRIVEAVAAVLPGHKLHLFGVKASVLKDWTTRPSEVYSVDSAAWNGRFKVRGLAQANAEQKRLGMKQREYTLGVNLPRYAAAVNRALSAPPPGERMFA